MLPLDAEGECAASGAMCLAGLSKGCGSHLVHNYEYYVRILLKVLAKDPSRQLFVIRSEHRWDDFRRLDLLWGGKGAVPYDIHIRETSAGDRSRSAVSPDRLPLLCRILCREIYMYKWTLLLASNLDDSAVRASFEELAAQCPEAAAAPPTLHHRSVRQPPLPSRRTVLNGSRAQVLEGCLLPEV
ncbi:unnamed protein product [Prorocentrum cordatum]|uniref:Uncharacterized protein n=1 Tax=Prorocentrum cordatum TaxID=2364126 RepID=A0ABN9WWV5_9DINO|nr:unnamed protein product [Polarella glacialis]